MLCHPKSGSLDTELEVLVLYIPYISVVSSCRVRSIDVVLFKISIYARAPEMSEDNPGNGPQQWISITGQPLNLGLDDSGFQGRKLQIPV